MEEMIKLERERSVPYVVNYTAQSGNIKSYRWSGKKGNQRSITSIPREVFDWLTLESYCFKTGELKVAVDEPKKEEVEDLIPDLEDYKNNTHSKEEIEKILNGNVNKMKSELKKITSDSEKRFVFEVSEAIKDDLTTGKVDFIEAWIKEKPIDLD